MSAAFIAPSALSFLLLPRDGHVPSETEDLARQVGGLFVAVGVVNLVLERAEIVLYLLGRDDRAELVGEDGCRVHVFQVNASRSCAMPASARSWRTSDSSYCSARRCSW